MFKYINKLLTVPAATNEESILEQMKDLVETLECMYKDGYGTGNYNSAIGTAYQHICHLRVVALYERFDTLVKMIKNVSVANAESLSALVNRYRAVRACIHIGLAGTTNTIALLDDFH